MDQELSANTAFKHCDCAQFLIVVVTVRLPDLVPSCPYRDLSQKPLLSSLTLTKTQIVVFTFPTNDNGFNE